MMTFNNIHCDIDCICTEGLEENTTDTFTRKISRNNVRNNDFKSHWERNKRPEVLDCTNICDFKAISLNIINSSNEQAVIEIYMASNTINPIRNTFLCKFKFGDNSGVVKHTPNIENNNPYHYNFFKSDEFNLNMLANMEVNRI